MTGEGWAAVITAGGGAIATVVAAVVNLIVTLRQNKKIDLHTEQLDSISRATGATPRDEHV